MSLTREDYDILHGLKVLAMKDVKCTVDKGVIAPSEYPNLGEAIDILKDIETVEAMDRYGETDYEVSSRAMPRHYEMRGNSYGRDPYYDGYGSYSNGSSYERGRSATTGRYISRENENEHMRMKLQDMMAATADPNERQALQRVIDRM